MRSLTLPRSKVTTRLTVELLEDRTVPSGVDVVPARPNDWPMFGHDPAGTRHNPAEHRLSPATVGNLEVKWSFQTDGPVTGTPAVVNDRVYAADLTGTVYALTRDGELLWRQTLNVPTAFTPKLTGSPLVTNRTVVIGDTGGQIHGLDVKTGELRWTTRPPNPGPVFGEQHPLQAIWGGGTMVGKYVAFGVSSWEWLVGSDPSYPGFTFRGNVVLLDPSDGRIVWQTFFLDESTLQPDGSFGPNGVTVWGSPAYDRGSKTIFVGTGQHYSQPTTGTSDALIALDAATGAIKWVSQKTAGDTFNFGNFDPNDPVDSDFGDSPQLYRLNGRLVVAAGQKNGFFHVVDAATGAEVAPPQQYLPHGLLGGFHIESGVAGGVNYATGNYWANAFAPPTPSDHGAVFAISSDGSNLLWKFDTDSPFLSGVAIANGVVYAQELDGEFHALDAATGEELALLQTGSGMSGPAISRGQIYLGDGSVPSLFNLFGVNPPGSIIALGLPDGPGEWHGNGAPIARPPAAAKRSDGPTLKGPMPGNLQFDPTTGQGTFEGGGRLTLMGKVDVHAEFLFAPGDVPGSLVGTGVAAFTAANGDVLVANVLWFIDPSGEGRLEFRWPDEITFRDGSTARSTGRFAELPFAGLRGTSTADRLTVDWGDGSAVEFKITMTGEIIDPDPIDL
jgi:polyvinyl alcohol dehydrogenase (cytochrome)